MTSERCPSDYEDILKVFPELSQKSLKDNPVALKYLTELCSAGLQRLHQETDLLEEEKSSILEQTQELAFHNYKTFIHVAECSQDISQDFNIIQTRLDSLLTKLPLFSDKCQEFGKQAQNINTRWREASVTLNKHPQLLEFLEMPQLMDSYVRNGYYEGALDLASYAKRLERKHSSIPLIGSIVHDIQDTLNLMLSQLLAQLRSNIQLPSCLKVIGYLRRMDIFSELELRIKFLQARGSWFEGIIKEIGQDDPYQHVIKVIEMSRTHLFDIVTQYRAIFSDDDPLLLTTKDGGQSETAIFQSWITRKMLDFINLLRRDLDYDVGTRIDSVYAQCMYFGLSFSRVGIDFRPLIIPVFENSILTSFCLAVDKASATFEKNMLSYTLINYSMTNSTVMTSSVLLDDTLQPPNSLLDYAPLAQYCNDIITAFNNMKLCSSFAIAADVVASLQKSLRFVSELIVDYERTEKASMTANEVEVFNKFCQEFSYELVPHFEKCLSILFPTSKLTNILGVTLLEFQKFGKLFSLDTAFILLPLENLLPPKDDDVGIVITIKPNEEEEEEDDKTTDLSEVKQEMIEEASITQLAESIHHTIEDKSGDIDIVKKAESLEDIAKENAKDFGVMETAESLDIAEKKDEVAIFLETTELLDTNPNNEDTIVKTDELFDSTGTKHSEDDSIIRIIASEETEVKDFSA